MTPVTISIAFVQTLLSGVRARPDFVNALLADAGIPEDLLEQPQARVTVEQYTELYRLLTERLDDEFVGWLSRPFKRGSFALLARSALGARNMEEAIQRIAHTFRLLQDDVELELVNDRTLAGLALHFTDPRMPRSPNFHEYLLRVMRMLLTWLAGGRWKITRFDFVFATPPYAGVYGKIFPAPLHFEQPRSAFWFDSALLRGPVRLDEPTLGSYLADFHASVVIPKLRMDDTVAIVRRHLLQTIPAWPDLEAMADALHMSTSTLHRRLAKEGTTFQSLKDKLRRDLAIVRLNTSHASLAEVAEELGFADLTSFQRAFKAWTGSRPGSYRRGAE